jgi:hypothetical protein
LCLYSSPCAAGICWVGWIAGAGLASPTVAVAGGGETLACAGAGGVTDLVSTAADCRGVGSGSRPAADGFGTGSGTARLATWGIAAGGRGVPRIMVGGGSATSGP